MAVTRTLNPLPFEALEPKRFEDLVRQLAYDFRPWRALEATGRAGSDDGFDARGFEIVDFATSQPAGEDDEDDPADRLLPTAEDRLWLIQCKRERSITPAKMKTYLLDLPEASTVQLYGMIFAAACDFSKTTRDTFRDWCRRKGISEAHIWGKAEIEDQLYQPKNDSLLFAYFGISLQIRQRSVKTRLRAKLAMKRKCERILEKRRYMDVLLRDPEDDRYPFKPDPKEEAVHPAGWRIRQFLEMHPQGLLITIRQFYAYIADDNEGWDFVESIRVDREARRGYPGDETPEEKEAREYESNIVKLWGDLPDARKAWLRDIILIRFEDILDIDETGDAGASFPHIFIPGTLPTPNFSVVESLQMYSPAQVEPKKSTRVTFFPERFLDPSVPVAE